MDEPVKSLVAEIVRRLTERMGADGSRGELLVVFSGATVGLAQAAAQVRGLILDGYRIRTVFSDNARNLMGTWVEDQLLGFPFVRGLSGSDWYLALGEAMAVVVPALSLNTASKVSCLIGDTLPATLMLHGLAWGKPVLAAVNGADPGNRHWKGSAGPGPAQAFRKAALRRLVTLKEYGCRLTDVDRLRAEVNRVLSGPGRQGTGAEHAGAHPGTVRQALDVSRRVVTAAHIHLARDRNMDLRLIPGAVVTPLARETAVSAGVKLIHPGTR